MIAAVPLAGIGEVAAGDDLAELIVTAARGAGEEPSGGDVVVVAHKVVSKAEGATVSLSQVQPRVRALELAREHGKDPRLVEVVLSQTRRIVRAAHGVLICETLHGFVCANAGVDASNVPAEDRVVLLPRDPDASARALRERLRELTGVAPGVVIGDSFGRAWRVGQCDVAIGCAGVVPAEDWRGRADANGRELRATVIAIADQLAATADLARRKDANQPVVLVRGAERHVRDDHGPGAVALVRERAQDLFR